MSPFEWFLLGMLAAAFITIYIGIQVTENSSHHDHYMD